MLRGDRWFRTDHHGVWRCSCAPAGLIGQVVLLLAALLLQACGGATDVAAAAHSGVDVPDYGSESQIEEGYISLADGVRLRYHMERADAAPPGPVLIQYDGYDAGTGGYFSNIPAVKATLMRRGYTMLGVSVRGTGCSSGAFSLFDPQWAIDGAQSVEWAAQQAWSNGEIGMMGYSYPGITQLFVAAQKPAHLRAIAPSNVFVDLYRDVGSPGGIPNGAFSTLFTLQQQAPGRLAVPAVALQGDAECLNNAIQNAASYEAFILGGLLSPHIDGSFGWAQRSPQATLAQIDVPVLNVNYWQDEQTGSRLGGLLEAGGLLQVLDATRSWSVMSNGNHDLSWDHPLHSQMLIDFFEHYLRGVNNGWEDTPRLQILHEMSRSDLRPQWITEHRALPKPQPVALHLTSSGELSMDATEQPIGRRDYLYPLLSSSTNPLPGSTAALDALWRLPAPAAGRLVWTSPPLADDLQLLGSASADLWLSSTAVDTDVQVTLSEVRADGQEVYLSRGWLRASKRALVPSRSTPTRPFHDHSQATVQDLVPGEPTLMRVEVFPFAHRIRSGSALRMIVDAPMALTGDWGGLFNPVPAVNTVWQGGAYDSKLVLGVLPDAQPRPPALSCAELLNQPCRDSIDAVPTGLLSIVVPED